jgi:hypothetical protein
MPRIFAKKTSHSQKKASRQLAHFHKGHIAPVTVTMTHYE